MAFNPEILVPFIRQVLHAPGTVTPDELRENKVAIDALITTVFEEVCQEAKAEEQNGVDSEKGGSTSSRKRSRDGDEDEDERGHDEVSTPRPKKPKKVPKKDGLTDEEVAWRLSNEINGRSRRSGAVASTNGSAKKAVKTRKKKSAATIESDGSDDDDNDGGKKRKKSSGGTAKGGFAKEYALSGPLAAVLNVDKMSRPQVVKNLWIYIKGKELQNPSNKKEIMCDVHLKAVFGVDKIDMFKMNKVLGQHLHENLE